LRLPGTALYIDSRAIDKFQMINFKI